MKILFVNDFYSGGGAEIWLHELIKALNPSEYETWLTTLSKTGDPKHYRLRSFRRFPLLRRTFFVNVDPLVYLSFKKVFQKVNPDIIHCGNLHWISLAPIEYAISKGTSCIVTLQDFWPICLRGVMVKRNLKICDESNWENCAKCKHKKIGFALSQFIKRGYKKRRKILLHKRVSIVAGNLFIKNSLIRFMYPPESIRVIYNGIDVNTFTPASKPVERKYVLFVGRKEAEKGVFDFLKIAELYHKYYGSDLEFILIGTKMEAQAVKSVGWIPRKDLLEYYRKAIAFLEVQYTPPGVGLSSMEAMSCGVPIIAYSVPGIEEFLKDEYNAFLVNLNDYNSVVEKLRYLKENEGTARVIGVNARKTIEERFSKERMIRNYERLYVEVTKQ